MKTRLITTFMIVQTFGGIGFAETVSDTAQERLQLQAKEKLQECSKSLSEKRVNQKSAFDATLSIFSGNDYPRICVEAVSGWYRKSLIELASSQPDLSDQSFRSMIDALPKDHESFEVNSGDGEVYGGASTARYSNVSVGDQSKSDKTQMPTIPGYTNRSGK